MSEHVHEWIGAASDPPSCRVCGAVWQSAENDAPAAPPRYCHEAGCSRSTTPHLWDPETCPIPPDVGKPEHPPA